MGIFFAAAWLIIGMAIINNSTFNSEIKKGHPIVIEHVVYRCAPEVNK